MNSEKKLFSFLVTAENKENLEKLSNQYKLSKAQMLNAIIADFIKNTDKKPKEIDSKIDMNSKRIEVKSYFTNDEYQALKLLAQKEFLSVKRYIKFLISQKIYDKDTPPNSEIFKLQEIVNQLIKLGINMNSVAKKLNSNNNINIDIKDLLESTLKNIVEDRKNFQHKISIFKKINNSRF